MLQINNKNDIISESGATGALIIVFPVQISNNRLLAQKVIRCAK
jgi:hypothetical protein